MRLGLSAETYRWVAFPWMRADRPAFRSTSHYAPYLLSVAAPDQEADVPNWLLERVAAHGLTALALDLGLLGSRAQASDFRDPLYGSRRARARQRVGEPGRRSGSLGYRTVRL